MRFKVGVIAAAVGAIFLFIFVFRHGGSSAPSAGQAVTQSAPMMNFQPTPKINPSVVVNPVAVQPIEVDTSPEKNLPMVTVPVSGDMYSMKVEPGGKPVGLPQ